MSDDCDDFLLLTHVLLSSCALDMGRHDIAESVGIDDQITLGLAVPVKRHYPAGSLVHAGLAQRLVEAGFEDEVVELARPVVAVVLEGDDDSDDDPYVTDEVFGVEAYSLPVVEPADGM